MLNKYSRSEAAEKVKEIVHKAGYEQCTPIQQNIVPLIFQGRDFFIETLGAKGKTLAALIAALLRVEYSEDCTQALIITNNPKEVSKLKRQLDNVPVQVKEKLRVAPVGYEKNPKRELAYFNSTPHLIIGTTERIIDHLRRDNIDVQGVELIIILDGAAEDHNGFLQDILFITSKISNLQQKIIFSAVVNQSSGLLEHLHRPHILNYNDWNDTAVNHIYYPVKDNKDKIAVLKTLYFTDSLKKSVLITKNPSQAGSLTKRLSAEGVPISDGDISITTFKNIDNIRSLQNTSVVFYQFPADYHLYARALRKITVENEKIDVISLLQEKERKAFDILKEEYKVDIKEENLPEEKEAVLKGYIEKTLKAIKEEENPEVLDRYKKIVKRHVPFFLRSYFTAYLLKQTSNGNDSGPSTTLFVSVGKNRKVFPKDLSKLFSSAVRIDPSSIGQIKILDSYSFIDIPARKAQEAIDKLNGKEYRGRNLTVNYARKKEDKKN